MLKVTTDPVFIHSVFLYVTYSGCAAVLLLPALISADRICLLFSFKLKVSMKRSQKCLIFNLLKDWNILTPPNYYSQIHTSSRVAAYLK